MTLILTELTRHGIAMAADSTLTEVDDVTGVSQAIANATQKLHQVPHLSAGVSLWGSGEVGGQFTDQWVADFIQSSSSFSSIGEFASELADRLNAVVGPNVDGDAHLGFHVAGFVEHDGVPTPTFYHVHDGPSTSLERRGIKIDPNRFNANHDVPPNLAQRAIDAGSYMTRNGDFRLYVLMFNELGRFFNKLRHRGIVIPNSNNLIDRAEYLVFQIRTVAEVYRLSNLAPGIGGAIQYLTITPAGIQTYGVRYY